MINPFFCRAFDTVLSKSLADRSCYPGEGKATRTGYERREWKAENNPHEEGTQRKWFLQISFLFFFFFFVSKAQRIHI